MRLLLFKTKNSPFFLSLAVPKAKELARLDEQYPIAASIFSELDSMSKRKTAELLEESRAYLTVNGKVAKLRHAKSLEVRYTDRDFVNGPAEGVTGFRINGIPCSACVEENGVRISWFEGEARKSLFVTSERYPVDEGEVFVHFLTGTSLYDFFSRLEQSLASTKSKFVWISVES